MSLDTFLTTTDMTNSSVFIHPLSKATSKRCQFRVSVERSEDIHSGARMKVFVTSFLIVF